MDFEQNITYEPIPQMLNIVLEQIIQQSISLSSQAQTTLKNESFINNKDYITLMKITSNFIEDMQLINKNESLDFYLLNDQINIFSKINSKNINVGLNQNVLKIYEYIRLVSHFGKIQSIQLDQNFFLPVAKISKESQTQGVLCVGKEVFNDTCRLVLFSYIPNKLLMAVKSTAILSFIQNSSDSQNLQIQSFQISEFEKKNENDIKNDSFSSIQEKEQLQQDQKFEQIHNNLTHNIQKTKKGDCKINEKPRKKVKIQIIE